MPNETIQSSSHVDVGSFKLSIGPVITTTPVYADLSSYYFSSLGLIEKGDQVGLNYNYEKRQLRDGTPSAVVYEFIIAENLSVEALLTELKLETLLAILNTTATHTNGSVDTTVVTDTGNSATQIKLASATGVEAGTLLKVGTEKPVLVESISSDIVTLAQALSATPSDSTAVVDITESSFTIGGKTSPQYYSILMEKTLPNCGKTITILIPKACFSSQSSINWDHDEVVKLPFSAEATKQDNVISDGLAIGWYKEAA